MKTSKIPLLSVLAIGFAVRSALLCSPGGQTPVQKSGSAISDATYHQADGIARPPADASATGMMKAGAAAGSKSASLALLTKIQLFPSSLAITGPHFGQRLIVEGTFADGHEEELTSTAAVTISNTSVARIENGSIVFPLSDGQATIAATIRGLRATAPLTIKDYLSATSWSFRNDVLPVMTKMGCNSGPCHGAAAGKNGFKLSLRGCDPITDYYTLTHRHSQGERIEWNLRGA